MAKRADVEAKPRSKQVDASPVEKQNDRNALATANGTQMEEAMEGNPISLLTATEIAKAAS